MPVYFPASVGTHEPTPEGLQAELALAHGSRRRDSNRQLRDHNSGTQPHDHKCTAWWNRTQWNLTVVPESLLIEIQRSRSRCHQVFVCQVTFNHNLTSPTFWVSLDDASPKSAHSSFSSEKFPAGNYHWMAMVVQGRSQGGARGCWAPPTLFGRTGTKV